MFMFSKQDVEETAALFMIWDAMNPPMWRHCDDISLSHNEHLTN